MDLERAHSLAAAEDSGIVSNPSLILSIPEMAAPREATCASDLSSFCRTLPPGKLYHVFFSHCNEDRGWVREMVEKLESPEFGFKCCYDERDFDLGVPVFQNITKCIHSSKRTVIVMSPEFLQSPWCSYETRITLELDLDTRQRLLIPVMLRNCKPPPYIGRLTYMEVQNEHFWGRFVAALQEESNGPIPQPDIGSSAIMAGVPFQFNPHFQNTDEIVEVTVYRGCHFCSDAPTDFVPNEIRRNGLQVTPSEYRDIITAVTGTFYVRCHGCFNKSLYALPAGAAFIVTFCFFILVISSSAPNSVVRFFGMLVFMSIYIPLGVYKICTLKATKKISRAIEKANTIAHTLNLMVVVKEYGWCSCTCDKMAIIFYYYDWRPCHSHMMQILTEQYGEDNVINPENISEHSSMIEMEQEDMSSTRIENEAWDLMVKHATEYCQLLLNRRSKTPSEPRHTRQGECLCQFVESILVSGETSCCDRTFGVKSRHPWKRYCLF